MAEYGLIIRVTETGIEAVSADLNRLNRQALDTAKSAGTLEKAFSKVANTIKGIVSIGAITAFAKSCIDTTADMAKLTGALASVTGSMENAQAELQRIKEIANGQAGMDTKSGVELVSAFMRMGDASDIAEQKAKALANAVASVGGDSANTSNAIVQLEQLAGKTSGFGEDLRSLQNSIPNINSLIVQTFGMTKDQLAESGMTGKEVVDGLLQTMGQIPQVAGGINSAIATIKSTWQDMLNNIGTAFMPVIEQVAGTMGEWVSSLTQNESFINMIKKASEILGVVLNTVTDIVADTGLLENLFGAITDILEIIGSVLTDDENLMNVIKEIIEVSGILIKDIAEILKGLMPLINGIIEIAMPIIDWVIKPALAGIMAIVKGVQWLLSKIPGLKVEAPDFSEIGDIILGDGKKSESTNKKPVQNKQVFQSVAPVVDLAKNKELETAKSANEKMQEEQRKHFKKQQQLNEQYYEKQTKTVQEAYRENIEAQKNANTEQINALNTELQARTDYVDKVKAEIDRERQAKQKEADDNYNKLKNFKAGVTAQGINHTINTDKAYTPEEIAKASMNLQVNATKEAMTNKQIDNVLYGNTTSMLERKKNNLESENKQLDTQMKQFDKMVKALDSMKEDFRLVRQMAENDYKFAM